MFLRAIILLNPFVVRRYKSGKIDEHTLQLLEKLSLVNVDRTSGTTALAEAVKFADKIVEIDTTNVEPLVTVLESRNLRLREDVVTEGNCRQSILKNASITEEEYFVAPPGNVPLE